MYKFLIRLLLIIVFLNQAYVHANENPRIISLMPSITEIVYAIGADSELIAVSTMCDYPQAAKNKEKVGDSYFINKERIIRLNPDYIFVADNSDVLMSEFRQTKIKPVFFRFESINDIYQNTILIGQLTQKEAGAKKVVSDIKNKIALLQTSTPKRILYVLQAEPMITIGKKSFITDVINKSGNHSVTENLTLQYPVISSEYAVKLKPDIVITGMASDILSLKKIFPHTKIVVLSDSQKDIINRPGPRIYKAVEFFAKDL